MGRYIVPTALRELRKELARSYEEYELRGDKRGEVKVYLKGKEIEVEELQMIPKQEQISQAISKLAKKCLQARRSEKWVLKIA